MGCMQEASTAPREGLRLQTPYSHRSRHLPLPPATRLRPLLPANSGGLSPDEALGSARSAWLFPTWRCPPLPPAGPCRAREPGQAGPRGLGTRMGQVSPSCRLLPGGATAARTPGLLVPKGWSRPLSRLGAAPSSPPSAGNGVQTEPFPQVRGGHTPGGRRATGRRNGHGCLSIL